MEGHDGACIGPSFAFGAAIMGMSKGGLPGAGNLTGGHLRPCSGGRIGAGRRASFRWVAFACLDLRRLNGNLGTEACRLEIHSPLASFLFG